MTLWVQVIVGQDESSPQGEKGTPEGWTYIPWGGSALVMLQLDFFPLGCVSVCISTHVCVCLCDYGYTLLALEVYTK